MSFWKTNSNRLSLGVYSLSNSRFLDPIIVPNMSSILCLVASVTFVHYYFADHVLPGKSLLQLRVLLFPLCITAFYLLSLESSSPLSFLDSCPFFQMKHICLNIQSWHPHVRENIWCLSFLSGLYKQHVIFQLRK